MTKHADDEEKFLHPRGQPSRAFRRWFSGSKIVDSEGNPLVVYHGTPTVPKGADCAPFRVFRTEPEYGTEDDEEAGLQNVSGADLTAFLGAHFTKERHVAEKFARGLYRGSYTKSERGGKGYIFAVYLSIKTPYERTETELREEAMQQESNSDVVDAWIQGQDDEDAVAERYAADPEYRSTVHNKVLTWALQVSDDGSGADELAHDLASDYQRSLRQQGYDGIIYENAIEGGTSYIVFEPTQIKAINNDGSFNPGSPDIFAGIRRPRMWEGI